MMSPVKIVFVINPNSGSTRKKPATSFISSFFDSSFQISFFETEKSGHASAITSEAVRDGAQAVVAIGGDGTVNEVAQTLNGTGCALGIIPCGSGNGLARHHGISLNPAKALGVIRKFKMVDHDAVSINGKLSFNVSGIGFDAHVAELFGKDGQRGFSTYLKLVIKEFSGYRENNIRVHTKNEIIEQPVMLAAIANASQFGNNARIAPHADTNDGLIDITLVRKMSSIYLPMFLYKVFTQQVADSPFSKLIIGEKFVIECDQSLPLHIDGEVAGFAKRFEIEIMKSTLKLIVP